MKTVQVRSNNLRNAAAAARRELGLHARWPYATSPSGDGLYRLTFTNGDVAEVTLVGRLPPGTGVQVTGTSLTDEKHANRVADYSEEVNDMLRAQGKLNE